MRDEGKKQERTGCCEKESMCDTIWVLAETERMQVI